MSRSHASAASSVVLGGALAGVAFGAAGGTQLTRSTVTQVLMVLAAGMLIAAALAWGRGGPMYGATALVCFAALAALTAFSIAWSIVPGLAYVETGRTFAYLAVFAAGVAGARLSPRASPVVVKGVALAAVTVSAYALAARVWPESLGQNEISNRIGEPFQYWNAVGAMAALAVPGLLWAASRRTGSVIGRALAYPGMGVAVLTLLLAQSRGALAAALIAAVAWFAIVPLRLRSLPVALVPAAVAGAVGAWALSKDPFAVTDQSLAAKSEVAGEFGLLVFLMLLVLLAAGAAVNLGLTRREPSPGVRRRVGIAALALACAVPLVVFTSVAFSDRGLSGAIEDRVEGLTSETSTSPTGDGAARISDVSSSRGKYWREAGRIFDERPWIGTGAGTFPAARLRHRTDVAITRHAHGFVPQTMADLGILGLLVSCALLLAWLTAAARTTALHPRRLPFRRARGEPGPRRDWNGERIALVALMLTAVVFGIHSAIDWTWFVPGPTAIGLVAAGFVAGRGPLGLELPPSLEPGRPPTGRILAAAGVVLAVLLACWTIWQPEASQRATDRAVELGDRGDPDAAIAATEDAADKNPLSAEPLLIRAGIQAEAGREEDARRTLEQAVLRFPGDSQTWVRLASFHIQALDQPREAAQVLRGALYLDPKSPLVRQLFLDARAAAQR